MGLSKKIVLQKVAEVADSMRAHAEQIDLEHGWMRSDIRKFAGMLEDIVKEGRDEEVKG